jgi:hypothetical protein
MQRRVRAVSFPVARLQLDGLEMNKTKKEKRTTKGGEEE